MKLRRQRRLNLGAQLIATAVDADTHARLQRDHDTRRLKIDTSDGG
jgi:hypothetical protein